MIKFFRLIGALPLLVFATGGCFIDDGQNPTTAASTGSTSEDTTTTGVTTETTETTKATESTLTTLTTMDTTDPTEDPSTTVSPSCPNGACNAEGSVEQDDACGVCGTLERRCFDGCWTDWACYSGDDRCAIWVLGDDLTTWQRYRLAGAEINEHVPTEPILAAFDAHQLSIAYVFTDTTYHVLELNTMSWIFSGMRTELLPELDGVQLLAISSVNNTDDPISTATERINFITPGGIEVYNFHLSTQDFTYNETLGYDFAPPEHSPIPTEIRSAWIDTGTYPWEFLPTTVCEDQVQELTYYGAALTTNRVHLQELSSCYDFVASPLFISFPAFTLEGAPMASQLIGATFWHDGLFVFREANE